MEHPELLQAYRSRRHKVKIIQIIVSVILAVLITMLAASAAHAEKYKELQDRYQKVEVGIAPGEHESTVKILETAPNTMEIVENPYQTIRISDSEYEELRWVLALAAQREGLEGEILCCEVIFNRVLSPKNWGTGVHGVLAMSGQFVEYKYINSIRAWAFPGETEDKAISECLRRGPSGLPDMKYVYFDTGKKNGSRNIKIGHHWFGAEK